MASSFLAIQILAMVMAAILLPVIVVWGMAKLLQGTFFFLGLLARGVGATARGLGGGAVGLVRHGGGFVRDEIVDVLRFGGGALTATVILPLAFLNFCLGRWPTAVHFGRALEDELISSAVSLYRLAIGNPARLLGLRILTDGIERRLPDVMARAPHARRTSRRPGRFDGYKVTGTLPAGGSGAQLYLARPRPEKLAAFRAAGHGDPGQVVIKAFALSSGSTLPQIVRESRALEAASRLGLVLEHELADQSFHYVMPFVPGETLEAVIRHLHARTGDAGLSQRDVELVTGYASDLLATLDRFHAGGLWHKDIKPSNLIVSSGRVHLVDLGLVTPLASAMTLTTHGTEYFRDPEMVRLALKGVKVHEVDGVRFDIYSAGAVLYSMIENSFPAHGSLSKITKRCPEALKWIVHRAMADMNARYAHACEMLADLRTLTTAVDPFAVKPAELPSVSGLVDWSVLGATRKEAVTPPARAPIDPVPPSMPAATGAMPASSAVRRRTSRGLLAAGVWGLFVCGAIGSLVALTFESRHRNANWPYARVEEGIARLTGNPRSVGDERRLGLERVWTTRLKSNLDAAMRGGAGSRAAGGGVLIFEDLGPAADRTVVDALRAALEKSGFEVFGGKGTGSSDPREIELEAAARSCAGLGDPVDDDAVRRLEGFLESQSGLEAIIWVARGDDEQPVRYRLITKDRRGLEEPQRFSPERELAQRR